MRLRPEGVVGVSDQVIGVFGRVPPAVWVGVLTANFILTSTTWSTARRRYGRPAKCD